ncbi:hypothetical protein [Geitlerinema calcuttense]|uniref:Uncharacterized protein n=1 Tax=Geitlerinema calcuttense NRMC-F 0142 TaxID=2922238 RepID=A0ABT7LV23_9CYAN|nr:hypothetical protein [Geitlerinema calcuttense]MDL5055888.1 hypothetical protein [Geitlerinema calcuttense NRMC-F 0142]
MMECYLIAVESVLNEAFRWMILLENGAMYNSVPLQALCWKEDAPEPSLSDICTWDCLGETTEIVTLDMVRNWRVESKKGNGRYLFSIHFKTPEMWQNIPEQSKVCHFCTRDDGNFMSVVNNETRFLCSAVVRDKPLRMAPNEKVWFAE